MPAACATCAGRSPPTSALAAQLQQMAAQQNDNLTQTLTAYRNVAQSIDTAADRFDGAQLPRVEPVRVEHGGEARHGGLAVERDAGPGQRPNGALGLLFSDSTLYRNLRNSLASADSLLADIKLNPGRYISVHIF